MRFPAMHWPTYLGRTLCCDNIKGWPMQTKDYPDTVRPGVFKARESLGVFPPWLIFSFVFFLTQCNEILVRIHYA